MTKQEKKMLLLTSLFCLSTMIIGICFYNILPDKIAIHFDIHNNPDNYVSKKFFVFGFPIVMTILQFIAYGGTLLKDENKIANKRMNNVVRFLIPFVTFVMYLYTICYALEYKIDVRVVVMLLIGFMFIVIGNYLPKTKKTASINLGFKKNLDDKTYKRVAHVTGYVMIIDGILMILSIFFHPYVSAFLVLLLIIEGVVLSVYTYKKSYSK